MARYGRRRRALGPANYAGLADTAKHYTKLFGLDKFGNQVPTYQKIHWASGYNTPVAKKMGGRGSKRGPGSKAKDNKKRKRGSAKTYSRTGKFQGRFKKAVPARNKGDKLFYNKTGSVFRLEDRGSLTSSESVYVGHSTGVYKLILAGIARAVVKKLFSMAGVEILNWDDTCEATPDAGYVNGLQWSYFANGTIASPATPVVSVSAITFTGTDTFTVIATALATDFETILTSSRMHDFYAFDLRYVKSGFYVRELTAKLFARDLRMHMACTSSLVVQNQTNATPDGGGADEQDEDPSNVTANPLKVMQYQSPLWTNGLVRYDRKSYTGGTTSTGLIPSRTNGVISLIPTTATNLQTGLYKLPMPYQFLGVNEKKTASKGSFKADILQPGDIKKSKIKFKCSMSFPKLMLKITDAIAQPSSDCLLAIGNCAVFGFEHVLKMSGDTDIKVGYQIDTTMMIGATYKKNQVSTPILQIN